ncbi:MAG: DUF4339 domain-containing protein [Hyphomonas sp.]|nr:DUF4339 domain-containing protein [Hyphomonas sp.]
MRLRPRIERVFPVRTIRPPADDTLDLADLDPAVWHVMSRDTARGPFTLGQLQAFAEAGKIGPLTRISAGHGEPFLPALDHAALRPQIEACLEARSSRRAEASNFIIVAALGSGTAPNRRHAFGAALSLLGRFAEPVPGTFILRARWPLNDVRRALAAALPEGTPLMIVESRDARISWDGLAEASAEAVRAVWDAPIHPPTD